MLLTRAPVATKSIATFYAAPRLACVRPVASVHPEPGSNSSLYLFFICSDDSFLFFYLVTFSLKNLKLVKVVIDVV